MSVTLGALAILFVPTLVAVLVTRRYGRTAGLMTVAGLQLLLTAIFISLPIVSWQFALSGLGLIALSTILAAVGVVGYRVWRRALMGIVGSGGLGSRRKTD